MEMEENQDLDEMFFDLSPFLAEIYSNGSPKPQTLDGAKQVKISRNSFHGQEMISTKPSSSSSSSSAAASAPQLISFENSNTDMDYNSNDLDQMAINDCSLYSQIISFTSSSAKDNDSGKKKCYDAANGTSHKRVSTVIRTPSQAQDHLMAERKRRENLSQHFITLSKVVPGLKKLDKASLLEDAINYLKALQERVIVLEKEEIIKKRSIDTAIDDHSMYIESSSVNNKGSTSEASAPEISVRIADRHVLVKICCKKEMGLMSRIPREMEKMHLSVIDMRIMPFGGAALDVTVLAEMQSEFGVTVKEIVDHLQAVFLNHARQI